MIRSPLHLDMHRTVEFTNVTVHRGKEYGWLELHVQCKQYEDDAEAVYQPVTFFAPAGNIEDIVSGLIKQLHAAREEFYKSKEENK